MINADKAARDLDLDLIEDLKRKRNGSYNYSRLMFLSWSLLALCAALR